MTGPRANSLIPWASQLGGMGVSITRLHKEGGETGHFGEFFVVLGAAVLFGGLAMIIWGFNSSVSAFDATVAGVLYIVGGLGIATLGAFVVLSGWGRHHPKYDAGGDPAVADTYDAEGRWR